MATDVTIRVTWSDGQVTRHEIGGLPDLRAEELAERLEKDLASYLDPDVGPLDADGLPLGWVAVDVVA